MRAVMRKESIRSSVQIIESSEAFHSSDFQRSLSARRHRSCTGISVSAWFLRDFFSVSASGGPHNIAEKPRTVLILQRMHAGLGWEAGL
jgi:hypothetical protein